MPLALSDYGLDYEAQVQQEEEAGRHAQAGQGLACRRAVLGVVVRVQGDDADADEQGTAQDA